MKYIDAEKLNADLDKWVKTMADAKGDYSDGVRFAIQHFIFLLASLQQEQPDDLASLISKATNVAKRIIDRDSFYNLLPQNIRNKYTFKAWCEILETLSAMKGQEQPEVDLEKITKYSKIKELPDGFEKEWLCYYHKNPEYNSAKFFHLPLIEREYIIARHFYELGLNARKEE